MHGLISPFVCTYEYLQGSLRDDALEMKPWGSLPKPTGPKSLFKSACGVYVCERERERERERKREKKRVCVMCVYVCVMYMSV